MIVSWEWLSQYVDLKMSHDELVDRLTMSGLNHEGTEDVDGDKAIDLEVTSNRPDCLGHLGVAREISVLFELPLNTPDPQPAVTDRSAADYCQVEIQSPHCYRYTARLIHGAKIGPSPDWMQKRLKAVGCESINNVVDCTNYVMFECGQPLHAFDFEKIKDGKIIVRNAGDKEEFPAIDHKTYKLDEQMCVIADADNALALGGVMGGVDSEISDATTEILVEAAYFNQLSVRRTARSLNLQSPSSFRFERDVDSAQLDWASRRCCELILETAGGVLLEGVVDVGDRPKTPPTITLRLSQLKRVLGIEIPADFSAKVLAELGMEVKESDREQVTVVAPSWRNDLTREVDLVEEVGRIYGFENVPDDAAVPMAASFKQKTDRVLDKVRDVLTAGGFNEALCPSLIPGKWSDSFSPWTDQPAIRSSQPMLGVLEKASQNIGTVNLLRRSLVPSLLEARRINEARSNQDIDLFETAKVYLPVAGEPIPYQPTMLAIVTGKDYYTLKGMVEAIVRRVDPMQSVSVSKCELDLFDVSRRGTLEVAGKRLGFLGEVSKSGRKLYGLRSGATVAEIDLAVLEELAILIPQHEDQSPFPPMARDFNFIVEDSVHWLDLEGTVREAGGELVESILYRETFRDPKKDGEAKKRLLLSVVLRSKDSTLTGEQADDVCNRIISSCGEKHSATLVS
ncbi:phenylalanine--tRNA ligase subunit beta [Mariniblastus fucicola]|uniref:Phenylalanine--tRNA ligase beta subunit n=1 Tax=Mariniblastus fucicola TaxID=980251 RepID=A0A5B9P8N1_9BACT|nr:phenylalanine--tRNA ligase subunit beta [Mariniblastus fucicola]QEG21272.1 Phenylalanine--tRNA ligase beta subunit [Mariniblastus fucicola]